LRVKELATAEMLTEQLPRVEVFTLMSVSGWAFLLAYSSLAQEQVVDLMTLAVKVADVSVGYDGPPVLEGISFSLDEGEIVGVIGPNGCGKTTLLKCIAALLPVSTGTVELFGECAASLPPARRATTLAVVPQELHIPSGLTVDELVMVGRSSVASRWSGPSAKDREIVGRAMDYADVGALRDRNVAELSGGEKQRAIVAMALAQEPRIILMDEVTSHLDLNHRIEVMEIVERLNHESNITVIMTSHDLNLASEFCRRLLVFEEGRLVADGPTAEVLNEDLLKKVYKCNVRVTKDPVTGTARVFPTRSVSRGQE
jgi:iron complex transport system ATP-binding protein